MKTDRPMLGILLMLGFCIVAPMGDAVAKILGQTVPIGQLLFVRFAVQVLLLLPIVFLANLHWRMGRRVLYLTILRTIMHIMGIGMMVTALQYLPLADAVAIVFVMPFIQLVLGKYVLGEEVGSRRLIASVVGFIGSLFVVQPSFANVGWPAFLPLGVALNFSLFMLVTRSIAKDIDPISLQTVSGVMAIAIMAPVLILGSVIDFPMLSVVTPNGQESLLLFGIGALGSMAHLLMTWSLRCAPSATLAPMQYIEIPFATVLGWLVFYDLPNALASFGIAITIAAGLYVMLRERAISLQARNHVSPQTNEPPVSISPQVE